MRPLLASMTLLLGLGLLGFAAAPPTTPRESDRLDYLFLGSDRPVLIRLHVRVGDKPYGAPWDEFVDRLFAWFDKDKDGFLSPAEVVCVPPVHHLGATVNGVLSQNKQPIPFQTLDTDKDGKVSKKELRDHYAANQFGPVSYTEQSYRAEFAKHINRAVYERLDDDKAGILTASKVAGMYRKLRALDENEDEILTAEELDTVTHNRFASGVARTGHEAGPGVRLLIEPDTAPPDGLEKPDLARSMLTRYDRKKAGKLSPAEIALPAARFAALDANEDGFLDEAELRAYLGGEPDIVLRLQLAAPHRRISVVDEKTMPRSLRKAIRRTSPDSLSLELGDTHLSIQLPASEGQYELKKYFLDQFDQVAGKKDVVTRAQAEEGQTGFLFAQADRNGDGNLTRAELIAWMDLVQSGRGVGATLMMYDLGRGLFPVLDADGDGRLTLREMKDAWPRLKPFAKDGKGVAQADLPRTLRLTVGLGHAPWFDGSPNRAPPPLPRPVAARPPLWFRKMDRNNDGDVSRKEWLGTDEEFAKIDADGDGLIGADEATAFEAKKTKDEE